MSSRIEKLHSALGESGLAALALNPGPSLTYLTGLHFHLSERPVVMLFKPGADPAIVLPELELLKVEQLSFKAQAFAYPEDPTKWEAAFRAAVEALDLQAAAIGVEPRAMRLLEFRHLRLGAPKAEYPDASAVVTALRIRKDADEIASMRKAVHIAQDALRALLPQIKAGMTERQIAAELTVQLLRHGSQPEMPFSPIVSGGPNGANPHASPSDRPLQNGDLLVIDWGASHGGYVSDLTRTFAIGEAGEEERKIHRLVQEANAAGRTAAKPGLPAAAVDNAARAVIESAGYGQYFTHRTGHGLGMEGHEDPYMRGDNQQILEPGMAFTVEPGIYLPGRNGVRIEDDVIITDDGAESLSDLPRELAPLG